MNFRFHKFFVSFVPLWLVLILLAGRGLAATKTWTGNAAAVPQITTLTVAGTWADTETATMTVNGKAIVVTLVGSETTANVAIALKEAWMAGARLDGTATTDATSNAGGGQFGEFVEMSATVSGSVVTLIGVTPGKPVTISVAETAAAGTLTAATPQAATGPHHWDNAKNWDTGTVPVDDDTVVFRDSGEGVYYGLPNGSLEVTIQQYRSFTGWIGLPQINRDNPALPYYEYRQRYVRLDDAGSGTNIAHRFGIGLDGAGSPLVNVKHSTVKCSPVVYSTGAPAILGTKALNLCCTANTSTLDIRGGSVDFSSQDGGTSAFLSVQQTGGDTRGITAIHTSSADVDVRGGSMLIGGTGAINDITVGPGILRFEDQTGTITALTVSNGGVIDHASTNTVTTLNVMAGGTFDARSGSGTITTADIYLYAGCKFFDPYIRVATPNLVVTFDPSGDLVFGANPTTFINISRP